MMGSTEVKEIGISRVSLCDLSLSSDETAREPVGKLELFGGAFALEFEANWARLHD